MGQNTTTGVILAGGFGTRLRSVVKDKPKALADVMGKPFLTFLLDKLLNAGIRRTVLCTGYLASQIEAAFGRSYCEMNLVYSREPYPLGTGGALAFALPHVPFGTVLVANGDSYVEADLREMMLWHGSRRASATILLTKVDDVSRYGKVSVDPSGAVIRFDEKREPGPGWVNAGVYLLERSVIESIPKSVEISLEKEIFPNQIGKGLCAWKSDGGFLDIGTVESYTRAQEYFA